MRGLFAGIAAYFALGVYANRDFDATLPAEYRNRISRFMREGTRRTRSIFWRLCLRSLQVKRPQAALAISSLVLGAAVCSLLLNLYGGVERKMTESFQALGANVILAPREASSNSGSLASVMSEPPLARLAPLRERLPGFAAVPMLYVVTRLDSARRDSRLPEGQNVVAVGTNLAELWHMNPNWHLQRTGNSAGLGDCAVGIRVAQKMQFHVGDLLRLQSLGPSVVHRQAETFRVAAIVSTGASEDDQVFVRLDALQRLAGLGGKVSAIELRVPGNTGAIETAIASLTRSFPGAEVRPVRQIVYSEGKVLGMISRLMLALTALILAIMALSVAATMTAIVLERRKDIAVMKALGASDRLVMELFLSEGAGLGLLGGLVGFFAGACLARGLALRLFHVVLAPSWWVFPLVCLSSMLLAVIATLYPVRIVRAIRPAVTLKGA